MPEIEIRRCWLQTAYKDTLEDRVEVAEVTVGCVIVGGVSGSLISHHIITPLFYTHTLRYWLMEQYFTRSHVQLS